MATEIDQLLANYVSPDRGSSSIQGVAFVVKGKGGKTLYSGSAGKLNFEPDSPPFTEDSVQWIASMTKLLTSVAALQVVEKGLIGLDDDVSSVLPELKDLPLLEGWDDEGKAKTTTQSTPITLRTLLTHSSGIGYDLFEPDLARWRQANPVEAFSVASWVLPLKFKPTEGWLYGTNIDWAGQIVERLSGLSLEEYFQKNFFKVLGIESSTFEIGAHKELHARRAAIGNRADPQSPLTPGQGLYPDFLPVASGGGGLYSTASDYSKFLSALLDKHNGIFQKEATYELLTKPQLPDPKYLEEHIFGPFGPAFAPEFQEPRPSVNHSLVGLLNLTDIPDKRRAGSVTWSGMSNPRWWIDPASGIAATIYTQILPPGDAVVAELFDKLERAVYQHLV